MRGKFLRRQDLGLTIIGKLMTAVRWAETRYLWYVTCPWVVTDKEPYEVSFRLAEMQHAAAESKAPTIPRLREEDIHRAYTVSAEFSCW